MIAKRFKFNGRTNCIEYDNKSILLDSYGEDIEEILNELHEENKTFREALQELKEIGDYQAMTINELHEENQRLQKENKELENFRHFIFTRMSQIYEDKE